MTPFEIFWQSLLTINIWFFAKIFVLLALALYIVFAFLVLKEVKLMSKTVSTILDLPLKIIAFGHLIFSLAIFVMAIIIL